MSADHECPSPGRSVTTYCYDSEDRLIEEGGLPVPVSPKTTAYTFTIEERTMPFTFEHDKQKRLFVLTCPDGKTERFRDNPARQLLVEPDPISGEMRPVLKDGKPAFLYLCREERER